MVKVKIERSKTNPGDWYWAVLVDGEVYADGEEGSEAAASRKAIANRNEYEGR